MPNYSDMAAGGFLHFDLLAWFSFLFLAFVSDLLLSLLFHSQPSSLSFLACPLALSSFKGRSFHFSLVFVFCSSPSAFPKITSNKIPVPTCASKAVLNAAEMWAHSDTWSQPLLSARLVNLHPCGFAFAEVECRQCKLLPTQYIPCRLKTFVSSKWNWHVFITHLITSSL